jgi:hypothetical protein
MSDLVNVHQAISYLLARPDNQEEEKERKSLGERPKSPAPRALKIASPEFFASTPPHQQVGSGSEGGVYTQSSASESRLTPKAKGKQVSRFDSYKRQDTAAAEFLQTADFGSPMSLKSFNSDFLGRGDRNFDGSLENADPYDGIEDDGDDDRNGEGWDALENVRACCDGAHE